MPTLSAEQKIQNMANFIKKQSAEVLYKVNQLNPTVDVALIRQIEHLCEAAETVRESMQQLTIASVSNQE